jgi:hypothetical protein
MITLKTMVQRKQVRRRKSPTKRLNLLLQRLTATGENGFEGLIARLLGDLTGIRFHLAHSGDQQGRDARANLPSSGSVAFECKRYTEDNPLRARDLLAELQQAQVSVPSLDLWILATSRTVPDQVLSDLETAASDKAFDILTLDSVPDGTGNLDFLCAAFPNSMEEFFPHLAGELTPILGEIRLRAGFSERIQVLRAQLLRPSGGWPNWQKRSHGEWNVLMTDILAARARLGQPLAVLSKDSHCIARLGIESELERWWKSGRPEIFAAVGEEGDGKSWAVTQWITQKTTDKIGDFPSLVFLPSRDAGSFKNIHTLLEQSLKQSFGEGQWSRKLTRWLETPSSRANGPLAVVVLDGLNERQSPAYWRALIESAQEAQYAGSISIICTARAAYWNEHFSDLQYLPIKVVKVPSFTDQELTEALTLRGKSLSDFPADLHPLLRKPRYLDLATRHSESMAQSGDITVARLIFEDWRDRQSRRETHLSGQGFNDLLRQMALEHRAGKDAFRAGEVRGMISSEADAGTIIRELATGGVLISDGGRLKVDPVRLPQGLGLLLADKLKSATLTVQELSEEIAAWLEPYTGSDFESAILEHAFVYSVSSGYRAAAIRSLLLGWINAQNPRSPEGSPIERTIVAYLPSALDAYVSVAEQVWSTGSDNPWAQEVLLKGFIYWSAKSEDIRNRLIPALERWLAMLQVGAPPILRRGEHNRKRGDPAGTVKKLFGDLKPGEQCFLAGYRLQPIDDNLWIRLSRVAVCIISEIEDRRPFVRALVLGTIVDAIFRYGSHSDEMKWVIRSSKIPLEETFNEHVTVLMNDTSAVAERAAADLLRYIGTESAWERRLGLDLERLFPTPEWIQELRKNSIESIFGARTRMQVEECAKRPDLKLWQFISAALPFIHNPALELPEDLPKRLLPALEALHPSKIWQGRWRGAEDIHLEEAEQVLARVDPAAISDLIRHVVRTVTDRSDESLLSMASQLDKYDLLLDDASRQVLFDFLISRPDLFQISGEAAKHIEFQFFQSVLWMWQGDEQLQRQRSRSEAAFDSRDFEFSFCGPMLAPVPTPTREKEWFRVLYFLGAINCPSLTPEQVCEACSSPDSLVRGGAFRYVYLCSLGSSLPPAFSTQWRWSPRQHFLEQTFGSLLLVDRLASTGVGIWIDRIDPHHRAWALSKANASNADWRAYFEWIESCVRLISGLPLISGPRRLVAYSHDPNNRLPGDVRLEAQKPESIRFVAPESVWGGRFAEWPPNLFPDPDIRRRTRNAEYEQITSQNQAAIDTGNHWLQRPFPTTGLDRVLELEPDTVKRWIAELEEYPSLLSHALAFYISLVQVLAAAPGWHEQASRVYYQVKVRAPLFRFVDAQTGLEHLDLAVFSGPESDTFRSIWRERYVNCNTDKDLLELALLARGADGTASLAWLGRHIGAMLQSNDPFQRVKAIAMRGFLEEDNNASWITAIQDNRDDVCWIKDVESTARDRVRAEGFARHWFRRFCRSDDLNDAWAAYRLFLVAADRRSLLWCWREMQELKAGWRKEGFFAANIQHIDGTLSDNEKKLAESFLNCKVSDALGPWMQLHL